MVVCLDVVIILKFTHQLQENKDGWQILRNMLLEKGDHFS